MPKFKDVENKTTTGISVSGGEITKDKLDGVSWEDLRTDYDDMMKSAIPIASSLNLLFYPIEATKLRIDVGKSGSDVAKEARDYIEWNFDNLEKGFNYNLRHKLLAIPLGLSMMERQIRRDDEYRFLKDDKYKKKLTSRVLDYLPIQNETIYKFHYEDNKFKGITHEKLTNTIDGTTKIEYVKLYEGENGIKNIYDLFSVYTFREYFNDVRGNSLLRPARLYWQCLKKIIIGRTVNIQKATGIIEGKFSSKPSDADVKKFENMAKALNALHGDNFVWHDENLEIILHDLKGQSEVQAFIEFLYKQILLSLLTEFISIGMGQVGAYNAGETQKSPYELSVNSIIEDLKRHYQKEIDYMIDISYLSSIPKEDRPIFEFNSPVQADLLKASQIILNFRNAGVSFTPDDMNRIRELLPFLKEKPIEITDKKTLQPEEDQEIKQNVEMKAGKARNVRPDILEFESATFEKENVEEHYLSIEEKANNIILATIKKILSEAKTQLKTGMQRVHIDSWYAKDLEAKMLELYQQGHKKGEADVKKEVKKVQAYKQLKIKTDALELELTEKKIEKQDKIISLTVSALLNKVKNTVEYDLNSMTEKQLNNIGGIDGYFDGLEESFDGVKRDVINDVTTGYTAGRNDKIEELSTDDTELLYSGILDKNFCDHCSQQDGLTYTRKEIEESKTLSLSGSSINLNCKGLLGKNKCRCAWVIYG